MHHSFVNFGTSLMSNSFLVSWFRSLHTATSKAFWWTTATWNRAVLACDIADLPAMRRNMELPQFLGIPWSMALWTATGWSWRSLEMVFFHMFYITISKQKNVHFQNLNKSPYWNLHSSIFQTHLHRRMVGTCRCTLRMEYGCFSQSHRQRKKQHLILWPWRWVVFKSLANCHRSMPWKMPALVLSIRCLGGSALIPGSNCLSNQDLTLPRSPTTGGQQPINFTVIGTSFAQALTMPWYQE